VLTGARLPPLRHATIVSALDTAAMTGRADDGLVFVGLDEREQFYHWSTIRDRAERAAASLVAAGVKPGDRVALILTTSVHFMDALFGTLLASAVPVPLYPPLRLGRLREYEDGTVRMLQTVGASVLVDEARVRPVLGPIVARARSIEIDAASLSDTDARTTLQPDADALGLIQFSSGSTIAPKAVALTHTQVLAQCAAIETIVRDRPDNTGVGCSWLPLYHDMGLIGGLFTALTLPARLILLSPEHFLAKPALWLRAISRHRAFISPAPNFAYSLCTERIRDGELAGVDLSAWSLALNGGEPVVLRTLDAFAARFAPFGFDRRALLPVYGLSEAALAVTFASTGRRARSRRFGGRDVVSVGEPVPGSRVRIIGPHAQELPDGEEGLIEVQGASVMQGYYADPAATARALRAGWLDTGDRGFAKDGELYVTGRAKDLVIVRGQNHAPQEFEEALAGFDGLRPGHVVAVGETFAEGEGLLLLAERATSRAAATDRELEVAVSARVVARTGIRPTLVRLLPRGTLPRTSSGKLRRGEALIRFRAGTLTPGHATSWRVGLALVRAACFRIIASVRRAAIAP
jgi:acyl-CoA synthetase (AMP-forming)/AMP-acid ligase II